MEKPVDKYNVWTFWDGPRITFVDMCLKTFPKNCKGYNLYILDNSSINYFLDNIDDSFLKRGWMWHADYLRMRLLYQYGGIWFDADTILLDNIGPMFSSLKNYNFVRFGGDIAVIGANPHAQIIKDYLIKQKEIIGREKWNYKDMVGWQILTSLNKSLDEYKEEKEIFEELKYSVLGYNNAIFSLKSYIIKNKLIWILSNTQVPKKYRSYSIIDFKHKCPFFYKLYKENNNNFIKMEKKAQFKQLNDKKQISVNKNKTKNFYKL